MTIFINLLLNGNEISKLCLPFKGYWCQGGHKSSKSIDSARCYGYVTMDNSEDASKWIQHLDRTGLHGRMTSVERVS